MTIIAWEKFSCVRRFCCRNNRRGPRSNGRGIWPTGSAKMSTLLMIILLLLVIGSLPTWPYSSGWGYYPSGGLGVILVVALVLLLFRGRTV